MSLTDILLIVAILALTGVSALIILILYRLYEIITRVESLSRHVDIVNRLLLRTSSFSLTDIIADLRRLMR